METYTSFKTAVGTIKTEELANRVAAILNSEESDHKATVLNAGKSWAIVLESPYELEEEEESEYRGMVRGIVLTLKS